MLFFLGLDKVSGVGSIYLIYMHDHMQMDVLLAFCSELAGETPPRPLRRRLVLVCFHETYSHARPPDRQRCSNIDGLRGKAEPIVAAYRSSPSVHARLKLVKQVENLYQSIRECTATPTASNRATTARPGKSYLEARGTHQWQAFGRPQSLASCTLSGKKGPGSIRQTVAWQHGCT
ncbi:hypothetical protein SCARD494_00097 [Seiridium cardinale]